MKRLVALATVAVLASAGVAYAAGTSWQGRTTREVALIGDSNISLGLHEINIELAEPWNPQTWTPVIAAYPGARIKWSGCLPAITPQCPTPEWTGYWANRLPNLPRPDVWVVNLGINDAWTVGTADSQGYGYYGQKIDYMMRLMPGPVYWTNLPCEAEPQRARQGCRYINQSLTNAKARWPNLTVVDWASEVYAHPEWWRRQYPDDPHYTSAGYAGWASLVRAALGG